MTSATDSPHQTRARRWINKHSAAVILVSVAFTILAWIEIVGQLKSKPAAPAKIDAYFYDLETDRLFIAPYNQLPPIAAPGTSGCARSAASGPRPARAPTHRSPPSTPRFMPATTATTRATVSSPGSTPTRPTHVLADPPAQASPATPQPPKNSRLATSSPNPARPTPPGKSPASSK